jgi:hypothetical protein
LFIINKITNNNKVCITYFIINKITNNNKVCITYFIINKITNNNKVCITYLINITYFIIINKIIHHVVN